MDQNKSAESAEESAVESAVESGGQKKGVAAIGKLLAWLLCVVTSLTIEPMLILDGKQWCLSIKTYLVYSGDNIVNKMQRSILCSSSYPKE